MIDSKRTIATIIICLKPYTVVLLSINLSLFTIFPLTMEKSNSGEKQPMVMFVGCLIATIFLFLTLCLMRHEVEGEVENLLIHFHNSRRGLRFLGVAFFHLIFILLVVSVVSTLVDKAVPKQIPTNNHRYHINRYHRKYYPNTTIVSKHSIRTLPNQDYFGRDIDDSTKQIGSRRHPTKYLKESERNLHVLIYKVTITTIIYTCLYFLLESTLAFYNDSNIIEFVHQTFVDFIILTTGIDLGDYGAGEMHFNPLIERRIR